MISVPIPVMMMVQFDQLNRADMIVSSPSKFVDGGIAMLLRFASNHHVAISGKISCIPRVSSSVRLCVRS